MSDLYRAGLNAKAELDHIGETFEAMEADILKLIADSKAEDTTTREGLYFQIVGLRAVRQRLIAASAVVHVTEYTNQLAEAGFSA